MSIFFLLGNGNYDPSFTPQPSNYVYVDTNNAINGNGLTPATPTNVVPSSLSNGTQLFFNSDSGVQYMPVNRDFVLSVDGNDIQISSYGSGMAVVSGFSRVTGGWTLEVGTVYSRSWNPTNAEVGSVINMSSTVESPQGDVMKWTDMTVPTQAKGRAIGVGYYAYDWTAHVLYINIGANPNSGSPAPTFGISNSAFFLQVTSGHSPARVTVHNLRIMGFSKVGINAQRGSNYWHIFDNQFYANGGNYTVSGPFYEGAGIQMAHNANNFEINNNLIEQTFDSPITPQHYGGSSGENIHHIHIHHNTTIYGALAGVEIADFGTGNNISDITVEYNSITGMGLGFSAFGDSPSGFTDGVHLIGDNASGTTSNIIIQHNTITGYNAVIAIWGNNSSTPIIVDDNRLSSALVGINNHRSGIVTVTSSNNMYCANGVDTSGTVGDGGGNSTQAGQCYTPSRAGEGVQASVGVSSRIMVSPGGQVYGPVIPSRRTNFTGHYATIAHNQQATYTTQTYHGVPLFIPGLVGLQHRIMWKLMEPSKGVYDFSLMDQFLAVCANPILNGNPFVGSGANGKLQMIVMIEDKTFSGTPTGGAGTSADYFPDYLFDEGFTTPRSTLAVPGSVTFRWDPYVAQRFNLLLDAMYAWRSATVPNGFDAHPNFEGMASQESSLSLSGAYLSTVGYTADATKDAYINVIGHADRLFTKSKFFWYMNFISSSAGQPGQARIGTVLDYMVANTDGACFGGPDVLHNDSALSNITNSAYSYYTAYKNSLDPFGSMQQNSFREANPSGTPAFYYTMQQQFDLAASRNGEVTVAGNSGAGWSLFAKRAMWNFQSISFDVPVAYDWSDASNIIVNTYDYNTTAITKV